MATSISASTTLSLAPGTDPATLAGAKDAFLNGVLQASPGARVLAQTDTFLSVVTPNPQNPAAPPNVATAILVTVVYDPSPGPINVLLEGPLTFTTTTATSNVSGAPATTTTALAADGSTITITSTPTTTSTGTIALP